MLLLHSWTKQQLITLNDKTGPPYACTTTWCPTDPPTGARCRSRPHPIYKCSACGKCNCTTSNFAEFQHAFISHSVLKIVWEILQEFEMQNIPRRKSPATAPPPPNPCASPKLKKPSKDHKQSEPRLRGASVPGSGPPQTSAIHQSRLLSGGGGGGQPRHPRTHPTPAFLGSLKWGAIKMAAEKAKIGL